MAYFWGIVFLHMGGGGLGGFVNLVFRYAVAILGVGANTILGAWTFRIFLIFFLLGEGKEGVRGAGRGRGRFFY